jgi:lipoprotein NlpI
MLGRVLLLVAAALLGSTRLGHADSIFEAPNALIAARASLEGAAGGKLQALHLTIEPGGVSVAAANPENPRHLDSWTFRFGHLSVAGPEPAEPGLVGVDFSPFLFELDAVDFSILPQLAGAALQRAALEDPGRVTAMTLERPLRLQPGGAPAPPRWTVEIGSGRESAVIYADASGHIIGTDLSGTNRARRLDLLAQVPLVAEAAQAFRREQGAGPILRRVAIGRRAVTFETSLADDASPIPLSGSLKPMTVLLWNLDGLQRQLGRVNADAAMGRESLAPFAVDEVKWDVLPALEAAAPDQLSMPQGRVTGIEISRPTDVVGRPALLWRVDVADPSGARGTVLAGIDGKVLQVLLPEGRRHRTDWRAPAATLEALRRIDHGFGPGALLSEITVQDDKVAVTGRDPRDPGAYVQALLSDDGFTRFGTPSPFATGNPPFTIVDLGPLSAERLASLESDTLSRLGLPPGSITTIAIGRGAMDPSPAGNVTVEIRAEDHPFGRGGRVNYEMDGTVIKAYLPDAATAASGDRTDCTRQGDPARSIAACGRLIDDAATNGPDRAVAYTNRGLAYAATGAFDHAIADQSAAIALQPDYPNPYNNRGLAYYRHGDLAQAIADYGAALEREPGSAIVLRNRALARLDQGDLAGALGDLDAAGAAEPDNAFCYYLRGIVRLRQDDLEGAAAEFDQAVQKGPDFAAAYRLRGRTLHALGKIDRAMEDLDAALRLAPQDANAHLDHGIALAYRGDLPGAERELAAAQALAPTDAYAAIWLVIVQRRQGAPGAVEGVAGKVDRAAWPGPVLDLLAGRLSENELLAAANAPDPRQQRGRICEARFYGAALLLLQGKPADARPLLAAANSDCPRDFTEWDTARAELAALGASP